MQKEKISNLSKVKKTERIRKKMQSQAHSPSDNVYKCNVTAPVIMHINAMSQL